MNQVDKQRLSAQYAHSLAHIKFMGQDNRNPVEKFWDDEPEESFEDIYIKELQNRRLGGE